MAGSFSPIGGSKISTVPLAPGYYAANVADFDGNRLEFVRKARQTVP